MRRLDRASLSEETMGFLWERRLRVVEAGDKVPPDQRAKAQYNEAQRLWRGAYKTNRAFDEIRSALCAMAPGHEYCMYCEFDHGSTIDHFCPVDIEPAWAFNWDNYIWSCSICNSVFKGTKFPRDKKGLSLLVNPVRDNPREHLQFTPTDGKLVGCTRKGEETVKVLGFDRRGNLDATRKLAWRNVQRLIADYADARVAGDAERALAAKNDLCSHPHGSLLGVLIDVLGKPGGNLLVQAPHCGAILAAHPEIRSWL